MASPSSWRRRPNSKRRSPSLTARLQPRQLLHVAVDAVVVERLQALQDLVEVAGVDALAAQRAPQRLEVLAVAARLAAELADVVVGEVAGPRVAPAAVVVPAAEGVAVAAATGLTVGVGLARLAALSGLAFLALLS